jgi:hypothetical protein
LYILPRGSNEITLWVRTRARSGQQRGFGKITASIALETKITESAIGDCSTIEVTPIARWLKKAVAFICRQRAIPDKDEFGISIAGYFGVPVNGAAVVGLAT